jgi:serine/threonine-protein kinase
MSTPVDRLASALAGRYRLERELGQGGMATVWLAHDLKHARDVAIKVLHPELAAMLGGERFLTEIRTTANLQHPHILPLFDSGEADGLLYYVMPYVEGETLRKRLEREHQLPIEDAVRIAAETASALEYAHKRGIVHRDIKPENILLQDGRPLVADFGIALAVQQAGGARLTQTGMSLGTPQYMAPEQAMGDRGVDTRADVYALGAVAYEMLAGEAPFTGPTAQAIVAKVMTERPRPLGEVRDTVSPAIEATVHRALQKLPADRWQGAGEFASALQSALAAPQATGTRTVAMPSISRGRSRWVLPAALGALAALAAFVAGRVTRSTTPSEAVPSWLSILAPNVGGSGGPALNRQIAISPDGSTILFVSVGPDGVNRLMRQRLDDPEPVVITGTTSMSNPRFAPDGRTMLAFAPALSQTVRLPREGGTPQSLDTPSLTGDADWDGQDLVWFSFEEPVIYRLGPGDSLRQERLEVVRDVALQQLLDGRRALAVPKPLGQAAGNLLLVDLDAGSRRTLVEGAVVEARYGSGVLAWVLADGSLIAAPFDERRGELSGPPTMLAAGVSVTGTGFAQMGLAANGTLVYIPEEPRSLVFVDRDGSSRPAIAEHRNFHNPVFAPDGRRIAVDFVSSDGRDVWILSLGDGTLSRATFNRDGHDATWSPDGRTIIYSSTRSGVLGTYRTRPGNAAAVDSLFALRELAYSGVWTPDGRTIVTVANAQQGPQSGADIVALTNAGRGPIRPIVATPFTEQYPALSPDGRWLAYASNQSGQLQVYVRPLDGDGDQLQVSQHGASEPIWGPNGHELFYRSFDQSTLEVASLQFAPELAVGERRTLFSIADIVATNPHSNYSISPDGRTFVMVRRSPATRIMVIQNLPALLHQKQGARVTP